MYFWYLIPLFLSLIFFLKFMSIHFNNFFKISLFTFIKLHYFDKTCFMCSFAKKKKKKNPNNILKEEKVKKDRE